jgi:pimeloyl-ACP methyl ester carboxylesterase
LVSAAPAQDNAAVLFVHGLWMPGDEAVLLRRRLARERSLRLQVFRYGAQGRPLRQIIAALAAAIDRLDAPRVHLIGHSLGGLVIQRCLERYPMRQPGRVVLLGAPSCGSRSAQRLARSALGRRLLGAAACEALLQGCSLRWQLARDLGVIAGSLPLGFGQLLVRFGEPNDGTVAVSETQLPGLQAHLVLPVSHMGLLFSAAAARETGSFLEHGGFGH